MNDHDEDGVRVADCPIHDVLCGWGQFMENLVPFLEAWRKNTSLSAVHNLADFVRDVYPDMSNGTLGNLFWDGRPAQVQQVLDRLFEAQTQKALETAFFEDSEEPVSQELSEAAKHLAWAAARRDAGTQIALANGHELLDPPI